MLKTSFRGIDSSVINAGKFLSCSRMSYELQAAAMVTQRPISCSRKKEEEPHEVPGRDQPPACSLEALR